MSRTIIIERERSSKREIEKGIFGRIKRDVTDESVTEQFKVVYNDQELNRILPPSVRNALITGDQSPSSPKMISPSKSKVSPSKSKVSPSKSKVSPSKSKGQQHHNQNNTKLPNCKHHVGKKRMHAKRMSGNHYHLKCPVCGKVAQNASPHDEIIKLRLITFG